MKKLKTINRGFKTVIVLFIIFVVVFFVLFLSSATKLLEHQDKMFSNIESLNALSKYTIEEIEEDKYLDDIVPINKFTYKINWNEEKFNVYAYVFEDDLRCMQYAESRKMPYYGSASYHLSSNYLFISKYIAYYNNKLLYVEGTDINSLLEFLNYIGENFDVYL